MPDLPDKTTNKLLWIALWSIFALAALAVVNSDDPVTAITDNRYEPKTEAEVRYQGGSGSNTPTRSINELDEYWPGMTELEQVECGLAAARFNDANEVGDHAATKRVIDEMNEMGCL